MADTVRLSGAEMLRVVMAAQLSATLLAEDPIVEQVDVLLRAVAAAGQEQHGPWIDPAVPVDAEDLAAQARQVQARRRESILAHDYEVELPVSGNELERLAAWARAHPNLDIAFRLADALEILVASGPR